MYKDSHISLVIPARNEERLIRPTLESVPEIIDRIYVVDDGSNCLLYTSPSPRDISGTRMPSSA